MILIIKYIFHSNYVGLSLWPFIILKEFHLKQDQVLVNHEKIHLRQQLEMLVIPFYVWYLLEWFIRLIMYRDSYKAYQNISFEREAYHNEHNPGYLEVRNSYSFIQYLWMR